MASAWGTYRAIKLNPPSTPYGRILVDLKNAIEDLNGVRGDNPTVELRAFRASTWLSDALVALEMLDGRLKYDGSVNSLRNRIQDLSHSAEALVFDELGDKEIDPTRLSALHTSINQLLTSLPSADEEDWVSRLREADLSQSR